MTRPGDPNFNPFPGLRPFQVEEEYLFFGREAQRQELIALLKTHRFVAVLGASGSGKSSLVRAGLLPALFGGVMVGAGSHWNIAIVRPGGSPIRNLAEALRETELWSEHEPPSALDIETTLSRSGLGLVEVARQARMPATENLLIVVDQFEELFRFNQSQSERSTRDEASAFVRLLLEATRQEQHAIYFVLTMRSDFFGDCAQFEDLPEAINKGEYLVPRLNRDQKKQAIEGPIKVGGGTIAARLMQRLLNDVGDDPDQLPILQHALMRTWEQWNGRRNQRSQISNLKSQIDERVASAPRIAPPLDLEDYEAIGGMREALSRHADEEFAALPDDPHRVIAEKIFKALTERGTDNRGIRRPTRFNSLSAVVGASDAEVTTVVEAFRKQGCTFLMPPEPAPFAADTVIDISHESLMRVWQRLRRWVEDEAQSARIYRRLADTAALHAEGQADLYHDPDLQIALSWREREKPTVAWAERYHSGFERAMEFLDRSAAEKNSEEDAREAARRRELEQAKALAATEHRRAEEQVRFSARLKWLVRGLGLVAMLALGAMVLALIARQEAQKNREMAEQNESRAAASATEAREQAAKANAEKLRADENAEKFRGQAYKVQLFRAKTALEQSGGMAQEYLNDCDPGLRRWEWERLDFLADSSSSRFAAHSNGYFSVRLSLDGKRMVTASGGDNVIKVWDLATRKTIRELPGHATSYREGGNPALGAEITPDGSRVISLSPHHIKVWDVETAAVIKELVEQDSFNDSTLSPDAKQLAIATENGRIGLWDLTTSKLVKWQVSSNWIGSICFSPDGKSIACGGAAFLGVVEASSGKVIRKFQDERGWVTSLAFSPDGKQLAMGKWAGGVTVYDLTSEQAVKSLPTTGTLRSVIRFSPDGKSLITGGGSLIQIWDAVQFEKRGSLRGHKGSVSSFCFGPDGSTLVSGSDDGEVRFWDFPGRPDQLSLLGHRGNLREVAFSPDGQRLVSVGADNTARVWDTRTGQELLTFRGHKAFVAAVAWSPDGRRIASGDIGNKHELQVWDPNSGQVEKVIGEAQGGHTNSVFWVNFNPDGTVLVSGSVDKTVRLWDTVTWKQIKVLEGFQSAVEGAAFSPDGKWIATCETGPSGKVQVWDWRSGQVVQKFQGPKEHHRCMVFSPDGKRVAVGTWSGKLLIWDLGTGTALQCEQQAAIIHSVAFSPDGARVFSGQGNGFINVWDARTGDGLYSFNGNQGTIWCVKPSPDGKTLATTGDLGIIQLWETSKIGNETVRRRALVDAARRVVDERYESLKEPEKVFTAIREDQALSDDVREVALQIATARGKEL